MLEMLEGRRLFAVTPADAGAVVEVPAVQNANMSDGKVTMQDFHFTKKENSPSPGLNYTKVTFQDFHFAK